MFDPDRLLVVRVDNLTNMKVKIEESCIVENPPFYSLNMVCLVKTSLAKTLLREKRPGEEKEYTQGYKYSIRYSIHLAKVEFEVGHIPSVGNLFPK